MSKPPNPPENKPSDEPPGRAVEAVRQAAEEILSITTSRDRPAVKSESPPPKAPLIDTGKQPNPPKKSKRDPEPANSGLNVRELLFIVALPLWVFGVNLALQKGWLDQVPDWVVGASLIIPTLIWIYYYLTHEWVRKRRYLLYIIPAISLIVLSGIVAFIWWASHRQQRQEAKLTAGQTTNTSTPSVSPTPTFTEGIDAVAVVIGGNAQAAEISDLQKNKRSFFIGDVSAIIYFDGDRPFVDVDIYNARELLPIRLRHNQLLNRPEAWDANFDDMALEVVNEKGQPVFQLSYNKAKSIIVINGLFFNGHVPVLASDKEIMLDPDLEPYPLKPIFKHPRSKYPGQRV
jgi:hypothetical protein